jgi:hypothetical protein
MLTPHIKNKIHLSSEGILYQIATQDLFMDKKTSVKDIENLLVDAETRERKIRKS